MSFRDQDLVIQPDPEGIAEAFEWKLLRPKAGVRCAVTCLSSTKFGILTHYTQQGTQPHVRQACKWCELKRDVRWHGYFEAVLHPTMRLVIVEMTPRAAAGLTAGIEKYGQMRGLDIVLDRDGARSNSPQSLVVKRVCPMPGKLPVEVPLLPLLKRIWQIPDQDLAAALDQLDQSVQGTVSELELMERHMETHDSDWLKQRATDLAGQLKLPLNPNGKK